MRIIGFAKVVGDVSDASREVLIFFAIALLSTLTLLWIFCGSLRLALLPLFAALAAVIWELGLLRLAGFGLAPFATLVPFLILDRKSAVAGKSVSVLFVPGVHRII